MPLFEDKVEVDATPSLPRHQISCKHCHKPAHLTDQDDNLPFLLTCPEGKIILGQWPTAAARLAAIDGFLLRAR
jgi:hypothetical protein